MVKERISTRLKEVREVIMSQVEEANKYFRSRERMAWFSFYTKQNKLPPIDKPFGLPKEDISRYLSAEFNNEPEKLALILTYWPNLEDIYDNLESEEDRLRLFDCALYTSYHHLRLN
mgnify:CR=1 FL=1